MTHTQHKLLTTVSSILAGLTLQFSPITVAQAEEAFTIKNGELQRPTGTASGFT